jgi:hypothetical protein
MTDERTGKLYVCKDAVNFTFQGQPVFLARGAVVRAGHPIMKGHEDLFEPLKVHYETELPAAAEPERPAAVKDEAPRSAVRADQQQARTR